MAAIGQGGCAGIEDADSLKGMAKQISRSSQWRNMARSLLHWK
jgi:hypothetical protein